MKLFDQLLGNEKLKKTLASDIFNAENSHAYILEGPDGSGKHTAAFIASAALFCKNKNDGVFPCTKCLPCRKALERISTDITVIGKGEKATLGVDAIREGVKATINLAPTEMDKKVYIIEDCDKMTPEAQNSLLLSLEEPPESVVFFLLCRDSSKLLETVKSRAPILRMELFSNNFVKEYLLKDPQTCDFANNKEMLDYAVSLSGGALGKAKELLKAEDAAGIETRKLLKRAVSALSSSSQSAKIDVMSEFPSNRIEVIELLEQMRCALRDMLIVKKNISADLSFFTDRNEATDFSMHTSVKKIIMIQEALADAESDLSSNLNVSSVLTLLASKTNQ